MSENLVDKLNAIFEMACGEMKKKLESGDVSSADLNVIRQFLKDNGINAVPAAGSPLGELKDTVETLDFPFGRLLPVDDPAVKAGAGS